MTALLDAGYTPEQILEETLGGYGLDISGRAPLMFRCNCDKARVEKALVSIGRKELEELKTLYEKAAR